MACTSRRNTDILSKTLDAEYRDSVMTFSFRVVQQILSRYQSINTSFLHLGNDNPMKLDFFFKQVHNYNLV